MWRQALAVSLYLVLGSPAVADRPAPALIPEGESIHDNGAGLATQMFGNVGAVAWSPDGARLATGSSDGTARIWDATSGKEASTLPGHNGSINSLAWSPDGRWLATGSDDNTARIWDTTRGKELVTLRGHGGSIKTLAWSPPDGRWLATGSDDNTARIWDPASGTQVGVLRGHRSAIYSLAWSPNGARIATGSADGITRIWNAASGQEVATLLALYNTPIHTVAWSLDGSRLATGTADSTVRIWDASAWGEVATQLEHSKVVTTLAWSPDGVRLATGSDDGTAHIWDAATGTEVATLRGHSGNIKSLAWSPDGARLATGSDDNTARIWDVASGRALATLSGDNDFINTLAWSPDGSRLATASDDGTAHIWDAASGTQNATLVGRNEFPANDTNANKIQAMAWSPDTQSLAAVYLDGTVRIRDAASGSEITTLRGYGWIKTFAWSPDSRWLAMGISDGTVLVWDKDASGAPATLSGHTSAILTLTWSLDGTRLATGSADSTARIWDAASGREIATLEHDRSVVTAAWSPDGRWLATESSDNTVRIWDASGKEVVVLPRNDFVPVLAWSPRQNRLATGSLDNAVRIWDARGNDVLTTMNGHDAAIHSLAWSPDGARLATGSNDNTARIWNTTSGGEVATLPGYGHSTRILAWSPDGSRLATVSADGRLINWDSADPSKHIVIVSGRNQRWVACRFPGQICFRFDDGSLMRELDDEKIRRIGPPAEMEPPKFEIDPSLSLVEIEVDDGKMLSFPFVIRNVGGRAYGIRLRAINPNKETEVSFAQILSVTRSAQLDVSQRNATTKRNLAETVVAIGHNGKIDGELRFVAAAKFRNPQNAGLKLQLSVVHAYGEQVLGEIRLQIRAAELRLSLAELTEGNKPQLAVRIDNRGSLATGGLIVRKPPELSSIDGSGASKGLQAIPSIEPLRINAEPTFVYDLTDKQVTALRKKQNPEIAFNLSTVSNPKSDGLANSQPFHTWTLTAPLQFKTPPGTPLITWIGAAVALAVVAYGGLVFGNPLLARASAMPAGLYSIGINELSKARRLLILAGRLDSVLSSTSVPKQRLNHALIFARNLDTKQRAKMLADTLELTLSGDFNSTPKGLAYIDAATSQNLLVNLAKVRLAFPRADMSADEIIHQIHSVDFSPDLTTVVVPLTIAQANTLRNKTRDRLEPFAVLAPQELTAVLLSTDPLMIFSKSLADQAPPRRLSAYQLGAGVTRAAAFFGREKELSNILNREPTNYIVIGGRQVGKSSLLKEIKRRLDIRKTLECSYLALKDADLQVPLISAFGLSPNTSLEDIYANLGRSDRTRRMILIDEADQFVLHEAATGYKNLAIFRRLSEEGRAYFILAGFWDLYRMIAFDYASPLRNFGEQVRIGGLDKGACQRMCIRPMTALNLTYENLNSVSRIYSSTAGRANLVSVACDEIVKSMSPDERIILDQKVENALQSFELRSQLEGWSELSGRSAERENNLDRIIVYSTIGSDGFRVEDIQEIIKENSLNYSSEDVRESLARLTLAFIINRDSDARYRFVVPIFIEMMKEQDLVESKRQAVQRAKNASEI
jgi:WD40 repeat protein